MILLQSVIFIALFATILSLGWGIVSMAHGGEYDKQHEGQFMSARVIFQAIAIVALLVAAYLTLA